MSATRQVDGNIKHWYRTELPLCTVAHQSQLLMHACWMYVSLAVSQHPPLVQFLHLAGWLTLVMHQIWVAQKAPELLPSPAFWLLRLVVYLVGIFFFLFWWSPLNKYLLLERTAMFCYLNLCTFSYFTHVLSARCFTSLSSEGGVHNSFSHFCIWNVKVNWFLVTLQSRLQSLWFCEDALSCSTSQSFRVPVSTA